MQVKNETQIKLQIQVELSKLSPNQAQAFELILDVLSALHLKKAEGIAVLGALLNIASVAEVENE